MAEGDLSDHVMQDITLKNLRDQAHAFMDVKLFAVGGDDARAFLTAVLQSVKAIVRQLRCVWMAVNAEYTAIMFGIILHHQKFTAVPSSNRGADDGA